MSDSERDYESAIDDAVARWIDRLLQGEELDPLDVLTEHPGIGNEVMDRLECFVGLGREREPQLTRLGDFQLIREIGRGGMGVVYEAHQESIDRRVAIKILPPGVAADRTLFLRFMREAQAAGKLKHEAIVGVHSLGIESDTPYYAMERVEGETLSAAIERERGPGRSTVGPFAIDRAEAKFFSEVASSFAVVADGLHHAHREGVIHRDIKPANLMVDADSRIRVVDFGLAYFEDMGALTFTGDVVGTPSYMSPEQAQRESLPVDHRTDIYSLGATLYEVITLQPPFGGKDRFEVLRQIVERDPIPPRVHDSNIPPDLETIVLKCMRRDPGERYGSAQAMSQDLCRFARGEPIEARPESSALRVARKLRRHRTRIIATVACTLLVAVVVWLALARSRAERERVEALFPGSLASAVGRLDAGIWVMRRESPPLSVPAIDFRIFESRDFQDVIEIGGEEAVREAIADLDILTEMKPQAPEPYFHLARAHLSLGEPETARRFARRARSVDPHFAAASVLESKLETPEWVPDEDQARWVVLRHRASRLSTGDFKSADIAYSELIELFESDGAPYAGALLDSYLRRAVVRLRAEWYDLAEEDCLLARSLDTRALAPDLLLGSVYLAADKPDLAKRAFARLVARFTELRALPFWIVSIYLERSQAHLRDALIWAEKVRDRSLKDRLLTYLHIRLRQWDRALVASRRATASATSDLISHQLLVESLIKGVLAGPSRLELQAELVEACHRLVELGGSDAHTRHLLAISRELLISKNAPAAPAVSRLESLLARSGIRTRSRGQLVDDFAADRELRDGSPFFWRNIAVCCPGLVEEDASGLLVSQSRDRSPSAWFVSEEIFEGDVRCAAVVDVGDKRAGVDIHVDLGSASLFFGGVHADGTCELGRMEFGAVRDMKRAELPFDAGETVELELSSRGYVVEFRAWPSEGSRPDDATLVLEHRDPTRFIGAVAFSTTSRPARFRRLRVEE